eukprot:366157-Chlamydomonas_euryale.AAC.8
MLLDPPTSDGDGGSGGGSEAEDFDLAAGSAAVPPACGSADPMELSAAAVIGTLNSPAISHCHRSDGAVGGGQSVLIISPLTCSHLFTPRAHRPPSPTPATPAAATQTARWQFFRPTPANIHTSILPHKHHACPPTCSRNPSSGLIGSAAATATPPPKHTLLHPPTQTPHLPTPRSRNPSSELIGSAAATPTSGAARAFATARGMSRLSAASGGGGTGGGGLPTPGTPSSSGAVGGAGAGGVGSGSSARRWEAGICPEYTPDFDLFAGAFGRADSASAGGAAGSAFGPVLCGDEGGSSGGGDGAPRRSALSALHASIDGRAMMGLPRLTSSPSAQAP